MTTQEFHERLKQIAKKRNITIKDLEINVGLPTGTISNWKKFFPAADTLGKVSVGLGTSVDYLLGLTECDLPPYVVEDKISAIILNSLNGKELTIDSALAVATIIDTIEKLQKSLTRECNLQF